MRIAWFSHRYFPCIGGAENYGREIVRRFVAAGHQVDVLTSDALDLWYFTDRRRQRIEGPAESIVDGARVRRFAVRHIPLQRYVGRLLSYAPHWPTRCQAASYMPILPGIGRVRGDYDAVFAVGFPFTVFSYAALLTARSCDAPLILTPFLHLGTPGDKVNRAYTRPHQVRLLAESDAVVVQTALEADAVASWGIAKSKILKLGMAVQHAEVTNGDPHALRDRLGIPSDRFVIGQLGVNDPNKGTCDTVRAVARLNESRPAGDPIFLILGGASSPEFEGFLAELPAEYDRWLRVLGPIAPENRAEFFAAIDLFALPSRTDSFGIVFLEAWANGLPVVAASAGGVAEVVTHKYNGLLVPFGDVDRLAASFQILMDHPDYARRLGLAGQTLVSQGHTWEDRFEAIQSLVRDRINGRKASRSRVG